MKLKFPPLDALHVIFARNYKIMENYSCRKIYLKTFLRLAAPGKINVLRRC